MSVFVHSSSLPAAVQCEIKVPRRRGRSRAIMFEGIAPAN